MIFNNSTTRLCSKKNWREPSALNLLNPGAQHMTSIKKLRFFSRQRTKVMHQGPRDSTRVLTALNQYFQGLSQAMLLHQPHNNI